MKRRSIFSGLAALVAAPFVPKVLSEAQAEVEPVEWMPAERLFDTGIRIDGNRIIITADRMVMTHENGQPVYFHQQYDQ